MPSEPEASRSGIASAELVRTRLIDAAERLIALRTDEGTSSRAIIAAAGQRHNSAITYYFGDRRGLLDAVWFRRSSVVNRRRRELVDAWSGCEPHLRELVEAWIVPFAEFVGDGRPSYWARFNEDELRRYPLDMVTLLRPRLAGRPQQRSLDLLVQLLEELHRRVGASPTDAVRVSTAVRMVISTFAAWEREAESGTQTLTAAELSAVMVDSTLGVLGATDVRGAER